MSGLTNSMTRTTEKSIHKIGFVVSAFTNYMRHKSIYNADPTLTAKHRKVINAMIKKVDDSFEQIDLEFLYNAFTERDLGEIMETYGPPVYADSGGLQMVTTKMGTRLKPEQIEKEKLSVYANQAKHSTYGFSFDEIPAVKIDEGAFGIGGSVFVKDLCFSYGSKAQVNLVDQYRTFKDTKSKSKIIPIIQGADTETTELYCAGLFDSLPEDFENYCDGLAIGGVNTSNIYAPTVLINDVSKVQNPLVKSLFAKRIHLLGVGSLSKFLGILIMIENDLLKTEKLTIDSASSSKGIWFGGFKDFNAKGKLSVTKLGKTRNSVVDKVYKSIWNEFEDILLELFDDYEDFMKYSEFGSSRDGFDSNKDRPKEDQWKSIVLTTAYALKDAKNVMTCIDRVVFKKEHFYNVINLRPEDKKLMCLLENCKTHSQVDEWVELVTNRKVKDAKPIVDDMESLPTTKRISITDFL